MESKSTKNTSEYMYIDPLIKEMEAQMVLEKQIILLKQIKLERNIF